jgi:hypothetical protein
MFFARHVIRGGRTPEGIGQPTQHRLRSEIAVAHLAFGVLGLLSVRFRGMFWFATIVGHGVFLIGVATVNVRKILEDKILLFDILMSLAHAALLKVYDPLEATRLAPVRRRFTTRS